MDSLKPKTSTLLLALFLVATASSFVYRPTAFAGNSVSFAPNFVNNFQTTNQNIGRTNPVAKVSLAGNYIIEVAGLPRVRGNADASRIGFRGCNTNSFSYQASSDGSFRVEGQAVSTMMFCQNDQDRRYFEAFVAASSFERVGSQVRLLQSGRVLVTLSLESSAPQNELTRPTLSVQSQAPVSSSLSVASLQTEQAQVLADSSLSAEPQITIASSRTATVPAQRSADGQIFFSGTYTANFEYLPAISVTFSESALTFQGCNTYSLPYQAFADGSISISNQGTSTEMACQNNIDQRYVSVLSMADKFERISNTITLTKNRLFLVTFRN